MAKGKQSEKQFQDAVVEYAQNRGWLVAHFRKATVRAGRVVTPGAYDASGFPDLVLARKGFVIFAELKAQAGRMSDQQREWVDELRGDEAVQRGHLVFVWKPTDWDQIERILK